MENVKQLIKEVLDQGYLMSLGTVDEGGVWVADVIYIHDDDFNIYWMSDPDVRHSQALLTNKQVSGTITTSRPKENNIGIQFSGIAEKIEGNRFEWEPEITAKILKSGIKIHEVPISYFPRTKKEGKKINWVDGAQAIWTLFKYRFKD